MKKQYYKLLGIRINLLTIEELNLLIARAVEYQKKWIIANHNLNSLYLYHHDPKMQAFYSVSEYIHIDGMALVILGKFLGFSFQRKHRVTYVDWIWHLMEEANQQGWRILYLGSKPGIADRGAKILRFKYPDLKITTLHGYFNSEANSQDNQIILQKINAYQPNVLMVGMGMPRQEQWILDNLDLLNCNVILPSGACMDYVAGVITTPPRWMGKVGLEWFYRLITEPKRLWRRYLIEPWFIFLLFVKEIWNLSILARE